MPDFSTVEDTLFVPLLGRIYASENFPRILYDEKALELKPQLPKTVKGRDTQTQYTLMASAVRSTNMDRSIQAFLDRAPQGVVAQLGCGLETTFFRNDNGRNHWFEIDLPEVTAYRRQLLGETERDRILTGDAFGEDWIKAIRREYPTEPILVTASGLFYYFEEEKVLGLFRRLKQYGPVELLFDAVSGSGMKRMGGYMKKVGHADASMYFYVDDAQQLKQQVGAAWAAEEDYYAHTERKGLQCMTRASMVVSDRCHMVKMIHMDLNGSRK